MVGERSVATEGDITVGRSGGCTFVVPDWPLPSFSLVTAGAHLHLDEGMRVNTCGDGGEDRLVGTYEELLAAGVALPIPIRRRRVNVNLSPGWSVFLKFVD